MLKAPKQPSISLAFGYFLRVLFLIIAIAKFVPFFPSMPGAGLDPSWGIALNQAVAQGLSFGKDIIITYGPYASIETAAYSPSTNAIMITGSLYLALTYWICFVLVMKGCRWQWVLIFCILISLIHSRNALLMSFPLFAGIASLKIILSVKNPAVRSKSELFYVALIFAPFGLLPLIKGTILILCAATTIICFVFFIASGRKDLSIVSVLSPLISTVLFWVLSGQTIQNLPAYFINMIPVVSGYTEAMAAYGDTREVVLFLMAAGLLLATIILQNNISGKAKLFLFSLYSIFLFLCFKGGFVRHDSGHTILPSMSILFAALLLPCLFYTRGVFLTIVMATVCWGYIDRPKVLTAPSYIAGNLEITWLGITNRIRDNNWPRHNYDAAIQKLRREASFPLLQGTTDIYSYNQAYLIASGNEWSPRPIFQSYTAYLPSLIEENKDHLLGKRAPNNIIFRVEPIDGRLPSLEDGASWPVLLSNYEPVRWENNFLFLHRKGNAGEKLETLSQESTVHTFGQSVDVPNTRKFVFAKIEIKPTILGQLKGLLYKPSQLHIALELENGTKKQYRIIAGMANSIFLISPLIESTAEFGILYGKRGYLNGNFVKSFSISSIDNKIKLWDDKYSVAFSEMSAPPPIDISNIYQFESVDQALTGYNAPEAEKCEGFIDTINDTPPASIKDFKSDILSVKGWLAVSVDKGVLPETVYVVLSDDHDHHVYLRTHRTPRTDVADYFKRPGLNDSGFSTKADISGISGPYTLGLAIKVDGEIKICPQYNFSIKAAGNK